MQQQKTGALIAARRKEGNMTQAQLAEKLGVTNKAVSRWETGAGFPDVSLLEPLADALEISVLELLRGEEHREDTIAVAEADHSVREALGEISAEEKRRKRREALKHTAIVLFVLALLLVQMASCVSMSFDDRQVMAQDGLGGNVLFGMQYVDGHSYLYVRADDSEGTVSFALVTAEHLWNSELLPRFKSIAHSAIVKPAEHKVLRHNAGWLADKYPGQEVRCQEHINEDTYLFYLHRTDRTAAFYDWPGDTEWLCCGVTYTPEVLEETTVYFSDERFGATIFVCALEEELYEVFGMDEIPGVDESSW